MKIVNLTPHELNILAQGRMIVIPPSGFVARCEERDERIGEVEVEGVKVPLIRKSFGSVQLPEPKEGVVYVASALAAQAAARAGRTDVLCPGPVIRDPDGRPIGVTSLSLP